MARSREPLISEDPVGTLKDVKAIGLNPAQYGSCSERTLGHDGRITNAGCLAFNDCTRPEKGTDQGFFDVCLRVIRKKRSGESEFVHVFCHCDHAPEMIEGYEKQGMLASIVAKDGDTVKMKGTRIEDLNIPGEGMKRFHRPHIYEHLMPARTKPQDNQQLQDNAFSSQIAEDEKRARRAEAEKSAMISHEKKR